jgi:hypothetical protein
MYSRYQIPGLTSDLQKRMEMELHALSTGRSCGKCKSSAVYKKYRALAEKKRIEKGGRLRDT